jgi:hypothetical protein
MHFDFNVSLDIERITGKFVSKDEIADIIQEALDSVINDIDLQGIGDSGESEYEVTDFGVERQEAAPKAKKSKTKDAKPDSLHKPSWADDLGPGMKALEAKKNRMDAAKDDGTRLGDLI